MNGDLLLIIDRRQSVVSLEGQAIRVERPDTDPQRIPLGLLGMVVAHGAPFVACDVWRALAERHIPAVLIPTRGRGETAWVGPGLSATVGIRRRQHLSASDETATLAIARRMVAMKIDNQLRVARRLSAPGVIELDDPTTDREAPLFTRLLERIAGLEAMSSVAAVMGQEGVAAAAWFEAIGQWAPAHWRFSGRNRRPPRDPINALLSLGYTLLAAEVRSAVQEAGLDPSLGFLHGMAPGRDSLVLDLMEPLRPGVDALVLSLLDTELHPSHFYFRDEEGCRLSKEGRALFYPAWARGCIHWPVPIPYDVALDFKPTRELQTDTPVETAGDPRLRAQCRRMIRVLRALLLPAGEGTDPDEAVSSNG